MLYTLSMKEGDFCPLHWQRAIILIDLNAFFASVEQRDNPELRGKPIAITNGLQGSCIITSSYEARSYGIKTGMRLFEAKQLCPHLIVAPTRVGVYSKVSTQIMEALEAITPDIEIFSIDEAFLDVTHCQLLHGTPVRMAKMARELIFQISGLTCSIGVSGDKATAKYAAEVVKPNGLTVIPPWEAEQRLAAVPVTKLCGIGKQTAKFLASYDVHLCGDMKKIPISVLSRRYGNMGRRMWLMCQGLDADPVKTEAADPKSVGHGKILPPLTQGKQIILNYFRHMSDKVAARLRRYGLQSQLYYIAYASEMGWFGGKYPLVIPSHDANHIFDLCVTMFETYWTGEVVRQIQVTALEPQDQNIQTDFFNQPDERRDKLNEVLDEINNRFGTMVLKPGRLIGHKPRTDVIAPAWRPKGVRKST